jgi:hypothetical protein
LLIALLLLFAQGQATVALVLRRGDVSLGVGDAAAVAVAMTTMLAVTLVVVVVVVVVMMLMTVVVLAVVLLWIWRRGRQPLAIMRLLWQGNLACSRGVHVCIAYRPCPLS